MNRCCGRHLAVSSVELSETSRDLKNVNNRIMIFLEIDINVFNSS